MSPRSMSPDWNALYETASGQAGHFTTAQAAAAGYSPQLLAKHLKATRIRRIRRGVYRIVHYPAGDHEDLVVLWLWSGRAGVLSHETALSLHELSDALPTMVHMTVPRSWRRRRLRVPDGLVLHYADVADGERWWVGPVPVTGPAHTLRDCVAAAVPPDLVRQALDDALDRGLVTRPGIRSVHRYLEMDA
ncbi:MAG: type IV toxin-antitoxin system AbiEi family antitoxin domain-containing protein [Planctomycetota bacterium]